MAPLPSPSRLLSLATLLALPLANAQSYVTTTIGTTVTTVTTTASTTTNPSSSSSSDQDPESPYLSSCAAGLNGVLPSPTPAQWDYSGNVRRYYIAAEEVEWDYAPSGWDNWLGVPLANSPRANMAGANTYGTKWLKALYRGYTDASFTELTDQPPWQGTQGPTIRSEVGDLVEIMFLNRLSRNYATVHSMGLTYIKADGGATYANVTDPGRNITLGEPDAVPPSNVYEGVEPGGCVVYKWMVEEDSGPDEGDVSKVHSYHSYVAMQQDTNAGLIGPHIVYGRGLMEQTMAEYREFTLLYMIYEESDSWLSAQNAERLNAGANGNSKRDGADEAEEPSFWRRWLQPRTPWGPRAARSGGSRDDGKWGQKNRVEDPSSSSSSPGPSSTSSGGGNAAPMGGMGAMPIGGGGMPGGGSMMPMPGSIDTENLYSANQSVWRPQVINLAGSNQFGGQVPSFFSMNGYIFANNPIFDMCFDDKVIWYVNSYGSMSHVFHMHGNNFEYGGVTTYAISVNDGEGKTLYMDATGAGLWQVLCHVNFHHTLGMVANYQVYYPDQCPLPALESSSENTS
ncbi:Cupredoxin [Hortaea werneckii]|nr:Cupredoxin [Hortaea werneckii]KAI6992193.1 Cupredoxin [Hortaea werneckii]KAI7144889.1 Cupredoxin [Hortaea werneckii]KAI7173152.1 Cupredoxin [Hortaea werneckii]